jgi:hypothetical protein
MQFQTQLMEFKSKNGVDFGPSNCHNEMLQQKLSMKHRDKTMTHIKVSNFSNLTTCICRKWFEVQMFNSNIQCGHDLTVWQKVLTKHYDKTMTQIKISQFSNSTVCCWTKLG